MHSDPSPSTPVSWEGDAAWANVLGNPHSRWFAAPGSRYRPGSAAGRLEGAFVLPELRPTFRLDPAATIFTIGSCFARAIENHLVDHGFDVPSYRFDIPGFELRPPYSRLILSKFTTHSMLNELRWALDPGCPFPDQGLLEEGDDRWVDPQVVGDVAPAPREVVAARRPYLQELFGRIRRCDVVVMTLGLVEAWFDRQLGIYLNRAPAPRTVKKHPGRFVLHLLDYRANREALEEIWELLRRFAQPGLRMVMTVSPVPLGETFTGRDVMVANAYSKSTLRAVAEDFCRAHEGVDYFPSYESVVLSDRRVAYQEDLQHVLDPVVDLNVRSFLDHYVHGRSGDEVRLAAGRHAAEQLAGLQGDLLADNARLRAERSALEARLARSEAQRHEAQLQAFGGLSPAGRPLAADGSPLPWSDRIRGAAEVGTVDPERGLVVSGWAVDPSDGREPLTIVVFVDGRPQACGATGIERPDVAQALRVAAPTAGFAIRLPGPACAPAAVVRVFALSAQAGARELDYHPETYELRTR
ncbi:MAG TPA: GSCFA domain-containing protein [Thermoanaerobaculia bacterium]|jgi:hypothetical protein|nr:GSCFA domain-containing protein [Thermoanaerobaculia bacterium]